MSRGRLVVNCLLSGSARCRSIYATPRLSAAADACELVGCVATSAASPGPVQGTRVCPHLPSLPMYALLEPGAGGLRSKGQMQRPWPLSSEAQSAWRAPAWHGVLRCSWWFVRDDSEAAAACGSQVMIARDSGVSPPPLLVVRWVSPPFCTRVRLIPSFREDRGSLLPQRTVPPTAPSLQVDSMPTGARKEGGTSPSGKGSASGWSPPERSGARPSGALAFHAGEGRRKGRGSGYLRAGTRSVGGLERRCLYGAVAGLAVGTLSSRVRLRVFKA